LIPLMAAGIGAGLILMRARMIIDVPLKLLPFLLALLGYGYTLYTIINANLTGDESGAIRLAMLSAIPFWPIVIYRFVVRRLSQQADEAELRARFAPLALSDTLPPSDNFDNREAVAVLKALGDMIERESPEDIPLQIVKGAVNALKADVVALLALDDEEYADVVAAWDNFMERSISALAIKIEEQPSLVGALESKDQRALRADRNLDELADLYTRLDIQRVGPAYYQALVKDGVVVAAMVVAFPYTQRELREAEQNLLTALAPIAARLYTISRSAVRHRDHAGMRALEAVIKDNPSAMTSARTEMQASLEAARNQINQLNNRVKELQIELDYERARLMEVSGEGDESITRKMRVIAEERAQLAAERESLLQAIQEAQTKLLIETRRDDDEIYTAMIEQLQQERDELQKQRAQLEAQLNEIRERGVTLPPPAVLRKVLTTLSEDKARLEAEREQLTTQMRAMNEQLKALGIDGPGALSQMLAQITEERTYYRIVAERALEDRELLLEERSRLNEKIAAEAEREAKFAAMEKVIRRLAADREALVAQRDQLKQNTTNQQAELDRWQQERARFVAEAESLQADLQEAVFERQRIQTELTNALTARAALEKERDRLAAERTTLQTERDQLDAASAGSRETLQRLGADGIGQLKVMIDDLTEERSELEHKLLRSQAQIETLREQLQQVKDRLKNSIPVPGTATLDSTQAEVMLSIAQELRTPLSSIVGYVDLMLGESVGILGALQRQFMQRVKANADRLHNLLEDFIRVTAIDTGLLQLQTGQVDLIEIIDDAITATRTQFREKGITLKIDLPEDLPPIQGDRDALQQVMIQLFSNAYLASPTDGEVGVAVAIAYNLALPSNAGKGVTSEDRLSGILVAVRDQGGGIATEDQARVFSRLYRADNPLIQGLGDTGVGLSIARALTEMHGGRIWAESESGVGSTFKLILPLQGEPLPIPKAEDSSHA
jgi:signal transduction histidine kinase